MRSNREKYIITIAILEEQPIWQSTKNDLHFGGTNDNFVNCILYCFIKVLCYEKGFPFKESYYNYIYVPFTTCCKYIQITYCIILNYYIKTKGILHWRNIKEYKDFTIGYNLYPLSWLVEILELRKGVILWVA